jgi:hypothetical protein
MTSLTISTDLRKSYALTRRGLISTLSDNGRLADLVIFPVSFLVMWGLFVISSSVPSEIAVPLLLVNLIWSVANSYQMQANFLLMFDLWSGEFLEMLRAGITQKHYRFAQVALGTVIGTFNLVVFFIALVTVFKVPAAKAAYLFITWPVYYTASLGIAFAVSGLILRLGKSYAFLTWTATQIIIMISSPFTELDKLPTWLQHLALISPFTYVFEFVRRGDPQLLYISFAISIVYFVVGFVSYDLLFKEARRSGRLAALV